MKTFYWEEQITDQEIVLFSQTSLLHYLIQFFFISILNVVLRIVTWNYHQLNPFGTLFKIKMRLPVLVCCVFDRKRESKQHIFAPKTPKEVTQPLLSNPLGLLSEHLQNIFKTQNYIWKDAQLIHFILVYISTTTDVFLFVYYIQISDHRPFPQHCHNIKK